MKRVFESLAIGLLLMLWAAAPALSGSCSDGAVDPNAEKARFMVVYELINANKVQYLITTSQTALPLDGNVGPYNAVIFTSQHDRWYVDNGGLMHSLPTASQGCSVYEVAPRFVPRSANKVGVPFGVPISWDKDAVYYMSKNGARYDFTPGSEAYNWLASWHKDYLWTARSPEQRKKEARWDEQFSQMYKGFDQAAENPGRGWAGSVKAPVCSDQRIEFMDTLNGLMKGKLPALPEKTYGLLAVLGVLIVCCVFLPLLAFSSKKRPKKRKAAH